MKKIYILLFLVLCVFTLNIQAQTPQYYNYNNVGTSSNTFPFGQSAGKAVNWLFLAGDFNQPTPLPAGQQITKVYFYFTTGGTRSFTNLHILMAQDPTLTTLTTGQFYSGQYDTVFVKDTTLTATSNGWMGVSLQHPYIYDPTKSLIIFVGQCAGSGSGMYIRQNSLTNIRRVWSVGGCPFVPYSGGDAYIVNFGVDVEPAPVFYYNYATGGGANSFPLGIAGGKMVQWLVLPYEFANPTLAPLGIVSRIAVRIATGQPIVSTTYSQFNILVGQSTINGLTSGTFYTGTRDTVYKRSSVTLSAAADSWLVFLLDHAFVYIPGQSLIIQIEQCGAPGASGYPLAHTTISGGNRRVWSVGGCPYVPYAGAGTNVLNCGIYIDAITGSGQKISEVPKEYRLEQNYPNPFNPDTKIDYSIPKKGLVTVRVYDVVGKEVKTLVNENKNPGKYTIDFDGSTFASGTYFYKLESNGFVSTKKMFLIK